MSGHSKVWIDLTDIIEWRGHHTGIQRVVYQLASRYSQDPETGYFTFDPRSKKFREASFTSIEQAMAAEKERPSQKAAEYQVNKYKVIAYKVYAKSPLWLKDRVATPKNKDRLRRVYHRAANIRQRPKLAKVSAISAREVSFGAGDTVLVLGKAWDYSPDFMEAMRRKKLRADFKLVQVVYDLIPIFCPHLFGIPLIEPYTKHLFEVCASSDGLLAISQSTKRDVQKFCKEMELAEPPIAVIHLGDDFIEAPTAPPDISGVKSGNFILSVGTLEVRKNRQLIHMAYKEGLLRGIDLPQMVIIGAKGWYNEDVLYQFQFDPQLKDKVHVLHGVNDSELRWLYENCLFTTFPSIYEGWGLPVAESLAYGKFCLTTNVSSMPEIAGDLLEYSSPYDSSQYLDLLVKYLDPATLKNKEEEIAKKYQPTQWGDTFKQAKDFLETKVSGHR
ncbi:MAG TPA: glycosyltransferase family 1 protein [Candidatus Saccharimonadales bacterium]|nr:glycosyltransferase family 1 protein [Candidatus Saccharimonadales bacterium]